MLLAIAINCKLKPKLRVNSREEHCTDLAWYTHRHKTYTFKAGCIHIGQKLDKNSS